MRPYEYGAYFKPGLGRQYWVLNEMVSIKTPSRLSNGQFALFEIVTPPGQGSQLHLHHHEDEAFYVVEGTYEFVLGERKVLAPSGSFIWAPRHQAHCYRNLGPGPGKLAMWTQPGHFENFITELGTPLETSPQPPPIDAYMRERFGRLCNLYGIELDPAVSDSKSNPAQAELKAYWVLGERVKLLSTGKQTGNTLCTAEVTSLPGGGPPPHVHRNADELLYILDGRFEILLGTRPIIVERGATVLIPKGTMHDCRNIGPVTGRFLSFHTPAGIEHFITECGTPEGTARPTTLLDPQWISRVAQRHGMETVAFA